MGRKESNQTNKKSAESLKNTCMALKFKTKSSECENIETTETLKHQYNETMET